MILLIKNPLRNRNLFSNFFVNPFAEKPKADVHVIGLFNSDRKKNMKRKSIFPVPQLCMCISFSRIISTYGIFSPKRKSKGRE